MTLNGVIAHYETFTSTAVHIHLVNMFTIFTFLQNALASGQHYDRPETSEVN